MCSGSEAGSYLRRIDFVYHSTLGLRVIKRRRRKATLKRSWWRLGAAVLLHPDLLTPSMHLVVWAKIVVIYSTHLFSNVCPDLPLPAAVRVVRGLFIDNLRRA